MNPSIPTPRPGSSWYYASLHTQPAFREDFLVLYAFYKIITEAAHKKEAIVANAKLNWWANELQNLEKSQHPLSIQLKPLIDKYALDLTLFLNFIHAVKKTADSFYFADESDLLHHCEQFANLYQIIARIQNKAVAPDFAQHLGNALTLMHFIRDMGIYLKHNKIIIPQTILQSFEIEAQDLFHDQNKWLHLMKHQANRAREYYQKAFKHSALNKQLNLLVLLELKYQLLNVIEKENFAVLDKRYHLTPLRKWWLAQKLAWRIK